MVLLLTAALLPMLVEYFMNYERKRQAITAVEVTLRVWRQLDGQDCPNGGEDAAPKRRQRSHFRHQRAQLAVQEDHFSLTPVFDDKQYKHTFRISKQMTQHILHICAITDPFFTLQQDVSRRYNIDPLAKVLMALKLVAYNCSPSAFQDYFQMNQITARFYLLKFCHIVSRDESLQSVLARKMTKSLCNAWGGAWNGRDDW